VNHAPVQSALDALGDEVPPGWSKAYESFRSAEWKIACRTSLHLLRADRDLAYTALADAQQRLAVKPTSLILQEFVGNCQRIFEVAETIATAATNGTDPVKVVADRQARAKALQDLRERHNLRQVRHEPTTQDEVDRLADLLDTVAQDERDAEAEATEVAALQAAATAARTKALDCLTDKIDKMVTADAREIASRLNARQVAIGREYPELVDEKILRTWQHAQHLAGISAALDGGGIDLDETVQRLLSEEQRTVLGSVVYRLQGRFLREARARHRARRK
jgi:hypothetical protein